MNAKIVEQKLCNQETGPINHQHRALKYSTNFNTHGKAKYSKVQGLCTIRAFHIISQIAICISKIKTSHIIEVLTKERLSKLD